MIFSGELTDKVLSGEKTQTRRPFTGKPCQYKAGRTYSIQRKRGTHGLGPRIRVLSATPVRVADISLDDARAEGFASAGEFLARWSEFYGDTRPHCWRIEFELVEAGS